MDKRCEKKLLFVLRRLLKAIQLVLYGWLFRLPLILKQLLELLMRRCCKRRKWHRGQSPVRCLNIPSDIFKRPDPTIYCQKYLKSLGLAVTYNNPDITLYENGFPVNSHALKPNTTYDVQARIWNNSTEAPAVHMPVRYSYYNFGIGQKYNPIGQTHVNLPVKGAIGHPTIAHMQWTTPATAGHYCLFVELIWGDDANPKNNLGQENTDVKKLNSPHAQFKFPLRNDTGRPGLFRLTADNYKPPPPPPCKQQPPAKTPEMTDEECADKLREAVSRHGASQFPVPPGWRVEIRPEHVLLAPEQEQEITVDVTAPDDNFQGQETFNVNAFDEQNRLVGGVTLMVEG
jgi:hypothetical protein